MIQLEDKVTILEIVDSNAQHREDKKAGFMVLEP